MADTKHSSLPNTPAAAMDDEQAWEALEPHRVDGKPYKVTVDDVIRVWLIIVACEQPPETWHASRAIIDRHVYGSKIGNTAIAEVTARDVDKLLASVARKSGAAVEGEVHQTLNLLFMYAWRHNLVTDNPTGGTRPAYW